MKVLKVLFWTLAFFGATALADEKPKEFKPNELQLARLRLRYSDAQNAQAEYRLAERLYQESVNRLDAEGAAVKVENKWPAEVKFDHDKLDFSLPAPPPEKKP